MATVVPVLMSLLLLLGSAFLQDAQDGTYSLTYVYTGRSRPREGIPVLQGIVYLNDQPFYEYNSDSRKAEPLGPWKNVEGIKDWKNESQHQQARQDFYMKTLQEIMDYYNDSEGSHILQEMFGCEIRNNRSSGAFWRNAYDGRDFIEFNTTIPAWIPLDPAAVMIKHKWETEGSVYRARAYLEEECPAMLRTYLEYSNLYLDRKDPPSVSVTSRAAPGNERTLKCMITGFYPEDIILYWTRTGVPLGPELGAVVPSRNGTYEAWMSVQIPAYDRGPYFCYVEHSSLARPLMMRWVGEPVVRAAGNSGTQPQ
ncbi:PREDICTED: zinc-alpha-2-glycoprotein-like [Galeopterus variegatus]|uniref:Zinc-alpha-2-glycoprotein-like n=1 Tax=Galeopterus variegatus TaxID=482537 RepID=A0ABM0RM31_GALVR|nr:PREDICTED: zinc-alpha-2-glycoprotein-like [Galeopterus variegatus]